MGINLSTLSAEQDVLNQFLYYLLQDLAAVERLLADGQLETHPIRIGAEQEVCLVDAAWQPYPIALDVLRALDDPHFNTEIALHNVEINLDPLPLQAGSFRALHEQLRNHLQKLGKAVRAHNGSWVLIGILPTIRRSNISLDNLTPYPRYRLLNEVLTRARGGPYEFRIQGTDELITKDHTIMFESCNTSFQVHLQIPPQEFVARYNWAQAIAAPVLAACANSPLLLGKRLWHETRIALFQQSLDTRRMFSEVRELSPRVTFGSGWMKESLLEVFRHDIAHFRPIMGIIPSQDSLQALKAGQVPQLEALRLYNSTVYRWNRPCLGFYQGKLHLRIECRYLPAGPSLVDQIANAAFWCGLMMGMPEAYTDLPRQMNFDDARTNFVKAARYGLETLMKWVDGTLIPTDQLILNYLLPLAREGLTRWGIGEQERETYLQVVEERVKQKKNGARWMLDSFHALRDQCTPHQACVAITAATVHHQQQDLPVHRWPLARAEDPGDWFQCANSVDRIMEINFPTVHPEDLAYLAWHLMEWQNQEFLLVEDSEGHLCGLLRREQLARNLSALNEDLLRQLTVQEFMENPPPALAMETPAEEARKLLQNSQLPCLAVHFNGKLMGMITRKSFLSADGEPVFGG